LGNLLNRVTAPPGCPDGAGHYCSTRGSGGQAPDRVCIAATPMSGRPTLRGRHVLCSQRSASATQKSYSRIHTSAQRSSVTP